MDNRLLNQFNNLYTITNNPDDVIPYKYFTNSFNGVQLHKIDILLENINIFKSSVKYNNIDNIIINRINNKLYLTNTNNPYHKQFIDNYNNKDKFKLLSIMGIVEKNNYKLSYNDTSHNNTIIQTNDPHDIIDNIITQLQNTITQSQNTITQSQNTITQSQNNIILLQTLKNNFNTLHNIDLNLLIENNIKNKSLSHDNTH